MEIEIEIKLNKKNSFEFFYLNFQTLSPFVVCQVRTSLFPSGFSCNEQGESCRTHFWRDSISALTLGSKLQYDFSKDPYRFSDANKNNLLHLFALVSRESFTLILSKTTHAHVHSFSHSHIRTHTDINLIYTKKSRQKPMSINVFQRLYLSNRNIYTRKYVKLLYIRISIYIHICIKVLNFVRRQVFIGMNKR